MNKSIMITGANIGLGKDTARQFALIPKTEKIYLGCRNKEKAEEAKKSLEETTGRQIFEIVIIDVSSPDSVRAAVRSLSEPLDALIMNAGGMGGKTPEKLTKDNVTQIFASNVLGHVVLIDELLLAKKLKNTALYVSSEVVRGVKKMGMKRPNLKTSSVDEFASIFDGSYFGEKMDVMEAYGLVKYAATLWMSSIARVHKNIRFISISPGATTGTDAASSSNMSFIMRFIYKHILMPMMGHKLEDGAKRFVDGIHDESLKSGIFYASKEKALTGPVVDQSTIFSDLKNESFQDNASEAIHRFIK